MVFRLVSKMNDRLSAILWVRNAEAANRPFSLMRLVHRNRLQNYPRKFERKSNSSAGQQFIMRYGLYGAKAQPNVVALPQQKLGGFYAYETSIVDCWNAARQHSACAGAGIAAHTIQFRYQHLADHGTNSKSSGRPRRRIPLYLQCLP